MARLSVGVSADANEASATFKELAADIKKVGTESVGVTDGVASVDAALAKLAKAADNPRALAMATAKVRVEVEDLRASLEKTPASAQKMEAISAALAKADSAIEKATARAGRLKDAMGDMTTQTEVAGKGAEALTGSFGSLEGILGKMGDSTSKASQSIAGFGFKVLAAGEAFKFGYEEGTKLNKFIEEHGNYLAKGIDAVTNFAAGTKNLTDLMAPLEVRMNASIKAHQAHAKNAQEAADKAKALGIAFTTNGEQTATLERKVAALTAAMLLAQRAGASWDSLVKSNAPSIKQLADEAARLNVPMSALPLAFQAAADGFNAFTAAQETAAKATRELGLSTGEFHRQATEAFAGGALTDWATKHADAIVATIEANAKAGKSVKDLSDVEEAAYKIAIRALHEKRMAQDEETRATLDGYAKVEAAARSVPDTLRKIVPAIKETALGYTEMEAMVLRLANASGISLTSLEQIIAKEAARKDVTGLSKDAYEALIEAINRLQAQGVDTVRQIDDEERARRKLNEAIRESEAAANAAFEEKKRRWAAEDAAANRTSRAPDQYKQIQDAAFGAAVAAGELGTNLDNVAAAVVATGGTMVVGAPYLIQYAQASREVTQALLDQAVATKALREEQAQSLEATKGWTDYLIALKDGYESGVTSLLNYKVALADFRTQLLQLFGAAQGEAKKSLQAILDLILELERTAGAGPRETFSPGSAGWLERETNRGK